MRSEQALVGKKVRVRGERYKPELRGEVRSVLRCFGASVLWGARVLGPRGGAERWPLAAVLAPRAGASR